MKRFVDRLVGLTVLAHPAALWVCDELLHYVSIACTWVAWDTCRW